jgi:hypothetical protein
VIRPALNADGGLSEGAQRKALDLILQVQSLKESPPLDRFFDFTVQKLVSSALKSKGWRPLIARSGSSLRQQDSERQMHGHLL